MVRFNFEVIRFQLNRHMAITKMIGSTRQIKRASMDGAYSNAQNFVLSRIHLNQ
jgi:hypothetical protein